MADHGDEGERRVVGLEWRSAEERPAVEIEPGSSQGSPSAKEHSEHLSYLEVQVTTRVDGPRRDECGCYDGKPLPRFAGYGED